MNKKFVSFEDAREKLKAYVICSFITCTASMFLQQFSPAGSDILMLATLIMMALSIRLVVKYLRCPHCNKVISFGVFKATHCPNCKRNLITGKKGKK